MAARPVPAGYRTVTPYLAVHDAPRVLDFVTRAFGAVKFRRTPAPAGGVLNVEVRIGDSTVMLVEARGPRRAPRGALVGGTRGARGHAARAIATQLRQHTA